jgi:hypothetical protein
MEELYSQLVKALESASPMECNGHSLCARQGFDGAIVAVRCHGPGKDPEVLAETFSRTDIWGADQYYGGGQVWRGRTDRD